MKKRVLIVGRSGRMGEEVFLALQRDRHLKYAEGIDHNGKTIQEVEPQEIDVVIDFSTPRSSVNVSAWCAKTKVPLVCGSTGFSLAEFKKIRQASKTTPILYSANMSLGIAVLKKSLSVLGDLRDFDFQIMEIHHKRKKDSPSGTAKALQKKLGESVSQKLSPILSMRGGGVFGLHEVHALGQSETLLFQHNALNRAVFAEGALTGAKFILKKHKGLFSMDDVLGL